MKKNSTLPHFSSTIDTTAQSLTSTWRHHIYTIKLRAPNKRPAQQKASAPQTRLKFCAASCTTLLTKLQITTCPSKLEVQKIMSTDFGTFPSLPLLFPFFPSHLALHPPFPYPGPNTARGPKLPQQGPGQIPNRKHICVTSWAWWQQNVSSCEPNFTWKQVCTREWKQWVILFTVRRESQKHGITNPFIHY